jgi:hypothetical protein
MQINFYPESDNNPEYTTAADEYAKIWSENQDSFLKALEKHSGLKFKTKLINAVIYRGISYSHPMKLDYLYDNDIKKATLMHELCHRLLIDNNFKIPYGDNTTEEIHKLIYLFLYDAWVSILGLEIAEKTKDFELSYNMLPYVNAWNFAMSFSKEERQIELEKMKKKYQVSLQE